MSLPTSASSAALLLACARPFSPDIETEKDTPTVPMRYGSAFHLLLSGALGDGLAAAGLACDKYDVAPYEQELDAHVSKAREALNRWLSGENEFGVPFTVFAREKPAAWDYVTRTSRFDVAFDEAEHTYESNLFELVGTADLVADSGSFRVVFDYKTGDYGDFTRPDLIPQMRALALIWDADVVAILHAPRNAPVIIYTAKFDSSKREKAAADFTNAMMRIGDGSMRPGEWCKRCPARLTCPTNNAELVKESNMLLRIATGSNPLVNPVDKGALNQFLQIFEGLRKQAKEALKNDVKAGEVIVQPNGKTLTMVTKVVSRFSKERVYKALGKEAGDAKLAELKALGCIEECEEESMVAK